MKIVWAEPALSEIQGIIDYYSSVSDRKVARKIVRKIYAEVQSLIRNPRGMQREFLLEDQPEEFRRIVEGNYKIIYYIEDYTLYIADIWDCRRDPEELRKSVTRTKK